MKNLLFFLLLCPILAFSQAAGDYLVFEIGSFSVDPENRKHVEAAMAAHNKKYHGPGPSGVRMYVVTSGPHSGEYKWVMGPAPWSALDARPSDDAHNDDWDNNVARYLDDEGNTEYTRFDASLSRFPKDFHVNKLWVQYVNVGRGKMDKAKEILGKIHKVYADKIPNDTYGIYFNELPSTSSGRDITIIAFFDKYAWMSTDNGFDAKYEEVHGKGSLEMLWKEWTEATDGVETEIWEFREDLSGISTLVQVAGRQ